MGDSEEGSDEESKILAFTTSRLSMTRSATKSSLRRVTLRGAKALRPKL
jgi:hypothetical protein